MSSGSQGVTGTPLRTMRKRGTREKVTVSRHIFANPELGAKDIINQSTEKGSGHNVPLLTKELSAIDSS